MNHPRKRPDPGLCRSLALSALTGAVVLATLGSPGKAGQEEAPGRPAGESLAQASAPYHPGQPPPGTYGQPGQQAPPGQTFFPPPGPIRPPAFGQPAAPSAPGPWSGQGPIVVPPISFVDVNSGRFGRLDITLDDGQFLDGAVERLHLVAEKMDLTEGTLSSLAVDVYGGKFQDFTVDRLTLKTQGALRFDTGTLFNHRALQFTSPAVAEVVAVVSERSLNNFLNSPQTLNRLSVAALKKVAFLESLVGGNTNLVTFTGANVSLRPENRLLLSMQTRLGLGEMSLPVPLELDTRMQLDQGWVYLADTRLSTSGQEISPQVSQLIVEKVNGLSQWGHRSDDIQFNFTGLQVLPGDRCILTGTALVNRLRFGRNNP